MCDFIEMGLNGKLLCLKRNCDFIKWFYKFSEKLNTGFENRVIGDHWYVVNLKLN